MLLALAWTALGVAIAIGGWTMDRLGHLNIEPWSAPGLVPGLLGALIAVFGLVLAVREARAARGPAVAAPPARDEAAAGPDAGEAPRSELQRTLPVLALCAVFVFGALGRGLPFTLTSGLLVFGWITMLSWPRWRADGSIARGLTITALIAVVCCTLIAFLFEDVFLVRLP
jgi:hypothetical protein